jgi:hypothetical protein
MGWPRTSYRLTGGVTDAADRHATRLLRSRSIGGSVYRDTWVSLKVSVNWMNGPADPRSTGEVLVGGRLEFWLWGAVRA